MPSGIGLFGGTFNPLHYGHLLLAETARVRFHLQRIIFIPCFLPPHKNPRELISAADRLALLKLGLGDNPAFSVNTWELKQKRVVYTYETLAYFRSCFPRSKLFFLAGSDTLADIPNWRNYPKFLYQCRFLIGYRPGYPGRNILRPLKQKTKFLPMPRLDISGRLIREYIGKGYSIRYLLPPAEERYIFQKGLYRSDAE